MQDGRSTRAFMLSREEYRRVLFREVRGNPMVGPMETMKGFKPWGLLLCLFIFACGLFYPSSLPQDTSPLAVKYFKVWQANPKIPNGHAYRIAMQYFNANESKIKNRRYLTIIDYTKPSFAKRMYVVDLKTGEVTRHLVSHGKNSGFVYAVDFSNQVDSLKSCGGFFLTGRKYSGTHGTSLALRGLQKGVNDNALDRGIVIHGSPYVSLAGPRRNLAGVGRSWGCPAVSLSEIDQIVNRIKNGSLLYIHTRS